MLLYYHLIFVASVFLATCSSIPIHQQAPFQLTTQDTPTTLKATQPIVETEPSTSQINDFIALDDKYYTIVSTVLDTTISEIKETAPETFLTIHDLQLTGRDYCRSSIDNFIQVLEHELELEVKKRVLDAVIPIKNTYNGMTMTKFNDRFSQVLGELLNPQRTSKEIIQKLYQQEDDNIFTKYIRPFFDKKLAQAIHHEKNEFFALEAWLRSWLMDIEFLLKDEFDTKIPILH